MNMTQTQLPSASSAEHPLGQRAYAIADHLASVIGPRPAASKGEQQALAYAEERLAAAGAEISHFAVDNIPAAASRRWVTVAALAGFMGVTYVFQQAPLAMLVYLPLWHFLPRLVRAWRRRRTASPQRASHNLLADHRPQGEAQGTLIIGAHVDTASAARVPGALLPRLQRLFTPLLCSSVLILALLAAVKLLTDGLYPLPPLLWSVVRWTGFGLAVLLALFEAVYLILARQRAWSPGANDNGSSVGVVLTAAEHFAEPARRPRHLTLRYALWTAEERGLVGSDRYAKQAGLDSERTWVLNMDMVGTGKSLSIVRGAGIIPHRRTSRLLNQMLRSVQPTLQTVGYYARRSDFLPFLQQGIPAASLTGKGGRRNWYYHTTDDVSEHLQPELLQQAAQAVIGLAGALDEWLGKEQTRQRGHAQISEVHGLRISFKKRPQMRG